MSISIDDIKILISKYNKKADELWNAGEFSKAIENYTNAINDLVSLVKKDESLAQVKPIIVQISAWYSSIGVCYGNINTQNPMKGYLNKAVLNYLKSLELYYYIPASYQNLLVCMENINAFLEYKQIEFNKNNISKEDETWIRYYSEGFDMLKGPDRERAYRMFEEALPFAPKHGKAITYQLLGLAYEVIKSDEEAVKAWLNAFKSDPNFNFESRTRIKLI